MNKISFWVVDTAVVENNPLSRLLTKEELVDLYPLNQSRNEHYVFKTRTKAYWVDVERVILLTKKYPSIKVLDWNSSPVDIGSYDLEKTNMNKYKSFVYKKYMKGHIEWEDIQHFGAETLTWLETFFKHIIPDPQMYLNDEIEIEKAELDNLIQMEYDRRIKTLRLFYEV